MSTVDYIRNTLDIKDENITFDEEVNYWRQTKHGRQLIYNGYLDYELGRCPNCGYRDWNKNGITTVMINVIPNLQYENVLKLKKQRYICRNCGTNVTCETEVNSSHPNLSKSLCDGIIYLAKKDISMNNIADLLHISDNTVARIIKERASKIHLNKDCLLPEHIAIDEFRSTKGNMSFIAIDAIKHTLIQILPGRKIPEIKDSFLGYSLANRQRVKTLSMDLNANYQQLRSVFPNAKIVVDRFHIIQMLGRAIDQERIAIQRTLDPKSREYKLMKRNWKTYKKKLEDINWNEPIYRYRSHEYLTDAQILSAGFEQDGDLEMIWNLYQDVIKALKNNDFTLFQDALNNCKTSNTRIQTIANTFKRNIKYIKNAIDNSELSNGPIEGIIRKIKQIKRTAYGYKNQLNFFIRIRLEFI